MNLSDTHESEKTSLMVLDIVADDLAHNRSRKKTRNASRRHILSQLQAMPNVISYSGGSKHQGTKFKKCKRKQQNKNKGGKK